MIKAYQRPHIPFTFNKETHSSGKVDHVTTPEHCILEIISSPYTKSITSKIMKVYQ